jgi:hypothetical protein
MGAIFFSISMGGALAPSILGSAMNASYEKKLSASLPDALKQSASRETMASLGNSRVLLSKPAMAALEDTFNRMEGGGQDLFRQTVQAIRISMESGLRRVFWINAIAMLLAFLLIITVPEVSLDVEPQDKKQP